MRFLAAKALREIKKRNEKAEESDKKQSQGARLADSQKAEGRRQRAEKAELPIKNAIGSVIKERGLTEIFRQRLASVRLLAQRIRILLETKLLKPSGIKDYI